MIYLNAELKNPLAKEKWDNVFNRSWLLKRLKHKAAKFELYKENRLLVKVEFSLTSRTSHAGFRLNLGLLGYEASIQMHDTRHWDMEKSAWRNYDDEVSDL